MPTIHEGEPDELDLELQAAAEAAEAAHAARLEVVRKALAAGRGPSRVARWVGWTREYVAKIRDGKIGPQSD